MEINKVVYAYFDGEECFYVGIGEPHRPYQLKRSERNNFTIKKIKKSQKRGTFHIQILHSGLTKELACWYERMYIQSIGRRNLGLGTLTNLTNGGENNSGRIVSDKTKKLLSEAFSGKNHPMYGKKHKDSTIQKMKGRKLNKAQKEQISLRMKNNNPMKGRTGSKNHNSKKVVTPEGIFDSVRLAAEHYNMSQPGMTNRIKNRADFYFA